MNSIYKKQFADASKNKNSDVLGFTLLLTPVEAGNSD